MMKEIHWEENAAMHSVNTTFPARVKAAFLRSLLITFLALGPNSFPTYASSRKTPAPLDAETCQQAAHFAASETGIPVSILLAISLTETGRKNGKSFQPWPWTVNMEGKGTWFKTRKAAFDYTIKNFNRGARSFDVGCFQINYKWHGKAFNSVHHMFDPNANAVYAAKYLLSLYAEMGGWEDAIGAYHSRTPKFANKYKKRFARIHAQVSGKTKLPAAATVIAKNTVQKPHRNGYQLLQTHSGSITSNGSLVSLATSAVKAGLITQSTGRLF